MNTQQTEPHPSPESIVNRLYTEFLNAADDSVADELIAPGFTTQSSPAKGPDAFRATITPLRQGFPDLGFEIQDMITEGDRVVVRWTWRATHKGAFAGIAATGRPVANEGIAIYRLENGKIAESWAQMDRLGVLRQLEPVSAAV